MESIRKGLNEIKIQMQILEKVMAIFNAMTTDERIPAIVRLEYVDKMEKVIDYHK